MNEVNTPANIDFQKLFHLVNQWSIQYIALVFIIYGLDNHLGIPFKFNLVKSQLVPEIKGSQQSSTLGNNRKGEGNAWQIETCKDLPPFISNYNTNAHFVSRYLHSYIPI